MVILIVRIANHLNLAKNRDKIQDLILDALGLMLWLRVKIFKIIKEDASKQNVHQISHI